MNLTTAAALRRAGRTPPISFRIALDNGSVLTIQQPLRVLPGKRLTGLGEVGGQQVLAKLFIAARGAERHWGAECRGLDALAAQQVPTPHLLAAGRLKGGGHYLLTEYLDGAQPLSASTADPRTLTLLFETLGGMHARGLAQDDPHLGNFLLHHGRLHVIDGDAIRQVRPGKPLPAAKATQNLALLLAQLPASKTEAAMEGLLTAYHDGHLQASVDSSQLQEEIARARDWRMQDILAKCLRDCSLYKVDKRHDRFVSVVREEAECLAPIVAEPDLWLEFGTPLKLGRTCTLALVEHAGRRLVIKRYNIKSATHALSRFWRPSRAWHSWIEGHRLRFLGIATPRPLALIERRLGPLRGHAWLITEYCEGPTLHDLLAAHTEAGLPVEAGEAVRRLFAQLAAAHISHGDLKATNFIFRGHELCVLDLDAMRRHGSEAAWRKAWKRDRARFLRNWPEGSALRRALDEALPSP